MMSSTKNCPRVGAGVTKLGTGTQAWPSTGLVGPRLSKAKSTTNVSGSTSTLRQATRLEDRHPQISPVSKKSPLGCLTRSTMSFHNKASRNVMPTKDTEGSPVPSSRPANTGKSIKNLFTTSVKNDQKKREKDVGSIACTILEDRALLKKGLSSTPEKVPRKPEALRKKCLSRSTSLWNVPVDIDNSGATGVKRVYGQCNGSVEPKKEGRVEKTSSRNGKSSLNRTTSLWNVPSDGSSCGRMSRAKSVSGLRPSKIPLFTQHIGSGSQRNLGQSLADLSSVDRVGEKLQPRIIDVDCVDHVVDDHIYQNYREANDLSVIHDDSQLPIATFAPIYENLTDSKRFAPVGVNALMEFKDDRPKMELVRTKSASLESQMKFDIEKRAAELMAELDDDEEVSVQKTSTGIAKINVKAPRINNEGRNEAVVRGIGNGFDNKGSAEERTDRLERRRVVRSQESLHSRREPEVSIQEIRRNWEQQIKRSQGVPKSSEIKLATKVAASRINSATVNLTKKESLVNVETTSESRKSCVNGKRAKDIEHLVNFFNCKNTDPVKETVIQDTWSKIKDLPVTIIDQVNIIKEGKDKDEKTNGYSSDGNCSEDSGHMSNENDVEWKEDAHQELKSFKKSERFLKEIIHDLDSSAERTIEVFDAKPIVQRFVPEENKKRTLKCSLSTSSVASSTYSWDENTKCTKELTTGSGFEETAMTNLSTKVNKSALDVDRKKVIFLCRIR